MTSLTCLWAATGRTMSGRNDAKGAILHAWFLTPEKCFRPFSPVPKVDRSEKRNCCRRLECGRSSAVGTSPLIPGTCTARRCSQGGTRGRLSSSQRAAKNALQDGPASCRMRGTESASPTTSVPRTFSGARETDDAVPLRRDSKDRKGDPVRLSVYPENCRQPTFL